MKRILVSRAGFKTRQSTPIPEDQVAGALVTLKTIGEMRGDKSTYHFGPAFLADSIIEVVEVVEVNEALA